MPFPENDVNRLLVDCHRRCCICHRFCGVKIETDHMTPRANGGKDTIDNAIAVCFECHAEIHCYNDKHPRGRKFKAKELQEHKRQGLDICRNHPEILVQSSWTYDVGPLQALIDELHYNKCVAQNDAKEELGCLFLDDQFRRAMREGAISTLKDDLREQLLEAYRSMNRANVFLHSLIQTPPGTINESPVFGRASTAVAGCLSKLDAALTLLVAYLRQTE
jgi:hypothetical protein